MLGFFIQTNNILLSKPLKVIVLLSLKILNISPVIVFD